LLNYIKIFTNFSQQSEIYQMFTCR